MAKQQESKKNILKTLLPKSVTVLVFHQNHLQVVHHQKNHKDGPKGSIKMIPDEARRRSDHHDGDSENQNHLEPTSPTVSCMGKIKCKKHQCPYYQRRLRKVRSKLKRSASESEVNKKKSSFHRIFRWRGRESSVVRGGGSDESVVVAAAATPELGQMNRFASGRCGALANFDWKAAHAVGPEVDDDDENGGTIISYEPIIVALRPKSEVNLWKRRNIAPPSPLI